MASDNNKLLNDISEIDLLTCTDYNKLNNIYPDLDNKILNLYKDELDNKFYNKNSNHYNNLAKEPTILPMRYWQDFYYLTYIAINMAKKFYTDNSVVVSLGESPDKLIFTQNCLFKEPELINLNIILKNVEFKILPLSRIGYCGYYGEFIQGFTKGMAELDTIPALILSQTINLINQQVSSNNQYQYINELYKYISAQYKNNVAQLDENKIKQRIWNIKEHAPDIIAYFKNFNLDPINIQLNNKIIYFVDRSESGRSFMCFLIIYHSLIEYLEESDKVKYSNLRADMRRLIRFIGYDLNFDEPVLAKTKIDVIKFLYIKYFKATVAEADDFYKFYVIQTNISVAMLTINKKITDFYKQSPISNNIIPIHTKITNFLYGELVVSNKVVNMLALPEKLNLDTRCIISTLFKDVNGNINAVKNKQNYKLCNLVRLVILIFMKKSLKKIIYLAQNIDKIDTDKFSLIDTNSFNFSPIENYTDYFLSFIDQFGSNGIMKDKLIFSDDTYTIPLIADNISMQEGGNYMFNKYKKYKHKYLQLKNSVK
jgi:hypothetical protein